MNKYNLTKSHRYREQKGSCQRGGVWLGGERHS